MNNFLFALNAILPIMLLIALGYYLSYIKFVDESFLKKANRFVFFVALPVLLFYNIYNVKSIRDIEIGIILIAVLGVFMMFLIGLVLVTLWVPNHRQKGVVLQCMFRSNFSIIGLPLALALGGSEAVVIVSILSAFAIPAFNILAVISLTMFNQDSKKVSVKKIVLDIIKNPLIIGVLLGLAILLIREILPKTDGVLVFSIQNQLPFLYQAIKYVAEIATPLALIVLGGQFQFKALKNMLREVSIGVVGRLVLSPIVGFGLAFIASILFNSFEMKASYTAGLVALFASPVAVSSAVMAAEMKSDESLASQLVVWTSFFSVFTIFFIIVLFRSLNLF